MEHIPYKIFQTWETKDHPPGMRDSIQSIKDDNPEFEYFFFDDNDRREYIQTHFPSDVLEAYDTLIPGAFRADLWRYCVLYKEGGIYMDVKFKCFNHAKLIELTDKEYFAMDPIGVNMVNGLMACFPGNPKLMKAIRQIVENVKNREYCHCDIAVTGPALLGSFFSEEEKKEHSVLNGEYTQGKNGLRWYEGDHAIRLHGKQMIVSYFGFYMETAPSKRYGQLWSERNIYR